MKLFAHHTVSGEIRSLTWFNAPEGVSLMLAPGPGQLVTEVQGHNLTGEFPSEKTLRDLAKTYVIAAPLPQGKLTKKPHGKS
jgi:hypothetical protein